MFASRAGYAHALAGTIPQSTQPEERTPSPMPRNGSVTSIGTRTMSYSYGPGVAIERSPTIPTDDDVILVTVRLSNKHRRQSYDDALPARPPKRSFFRRVSTRILPGPDEDKYKAVKMPRGEYKRHFARDGSGNYAGSEPQRDWDEDDIKRQYGMYQDLPIGTVL